MFFELYTYCETEILEDLYISARVSFIFKEELFVADNSSSEDILLKFDGSSLSLAIGSTAIFSLPSVPKFSLHNLAITKKNNLRIIKN